MVKLNKNNIAGGIIKVVESYPATFIGGAIGGAVSALGFNKFTESCRFWN